MISLPARLEHITPTQAYRMMMLTVGIIILILVSVIGQWQQQAEKNYLQTQQRYQQLQTIAAGLPPTPAIKLQGDGLLQKIAAHPLMSLSGKVSNLSLQGNKVTARIDNAPSAALLDWLWQLEQQGVMVTAMSLTHLSQGLVSGNMTWGQE